MQWLTSTKQTRITHQEGNGKGHLPHKENACCPSLKWRRGSFLARKVLCCRLVFQANKVNLAKPNYVYSSKSKEKAQCFFLGPQRHCRYTGQSWGHSSAPRPLNMCLQDIHSLHSKQAPRVGVGTWYGRQQSPWESSGKLQRCSLGQTQPSQQDPFSAQGVMLLSCLTPLCLQNLSIHL